MSSQNSENVPSCMKVITETAFHEAVAMIPRLFEPRYYIIVISVHLAPLSHTHGMRGIPRLSHRPGRKGSNNVISASFSSRLLLTAVSVYGVGKEQEMTDISHKLPQLSQRGDQPLLSDIWELFWTIFGGFLIKLTFTWLI